MTKTTETTDTERTPGHPSEDTPRTDYAATLVSPEAYVVVCPACEHRHEAESTWAYRCPECNKAISVNI